MYNPKNVFGMEEVKVQKNKGVQSYGPKPSMKGVKTSGIKMRGAGAATKGFTCRGPMG